MVGWSRSPRVILGMDDAVAPPRGTLRRATWMRIGFAALTLLAACGDEQNDRSSFLVADAATVRLVYRFNDSSVPPEYHRSYTLTADSLSANLVVDSYGDVLHDVIEPNVDAVWHRALGASADVAEAADVTTDGCAGGTSEELRMLDEGDVVLIDVHVDHCGTSAGPDLAAVVSELLALFDLDVLLATE